MRRFTHVFTLVLIFVFVFCGNVFAAENTLPDGFVIADSDGVRAGSDGGYLIQKTEIEPGDILTQTITIRNLRDDREAYDLSLLADPAELSGPVNLRQHSTLTMTLDGIVVYTGPVDGEVGGMLQENALHLGRFEYGDEAILQVRIVIDDDWNITYTQNTAKFGWHFDAQQVVVDITDPTTPAPAPNTGQIIQYIFYVLVGLLVVAVIVLYAAHKKRQKTLA